MNNQDQKQKALKHLHMCMYYFYKYALTKDGEYCGKFFKQADKFKRFLNKWNQT